MKKLSMTLALLLVSSLALARPVVQEYSLASTDCDGEPVALADYTAVELYASDVPIPVQATDPCQVDANGNAVDVPPAGAEVVAGVVTDNSVEFNLTPGTWYVRMRARDADGWSNLSSQSTIVIPRGKKRPPVLVRFTF